jgi:hypothetical protein
VNGRSVKRGAQVVGRSVPWLSSWNASIAATSQREREEKLAGRHAMLWFPLVEGHHQDRLEFAAVCRQLVHGAGVRQRLQSPLDDAGGLDVLESLREGVGTNARETRQPIVEPQRAEQQMTCDQKRPAIGDHV